MDFSQDEREYKWFEAAKSYEQALHSRSLPPSSAADYWQRIGYYYDLASRQTSDIEEFKNLRRLAVEAYEKAAELFVEGLTSENQGRAHNVSPSLSMRAPGWHPALLRNKKH